jgi:hypothetical protein
MRQKRRLLVVVTMLAILAGVLIFASRRKPTSAPAARIILISYTNFTMIQPDTNVFVFPGRGSWISAKMVLTNKGTVSISYGAWGYEPNGWATVETAQGKTNGYLAPPFTGGSAVLRPGHATIFSVILPTNTLQWQCGFNIEATSVRERVIWRVLENKFVQKFPRLCLHLWLWLPDKVAGSVNEVRSPMMEITNRTRASASPSAPN